MSSQAYHIELDQGGSWLSRVKFTLGEVELNPCQVE